MAGKVVQADERATVKELTLGSDFTLKLPTYKIVHIHSISNG